MDLSTKDPQQKIGLIDEHWKARKGLRLLARIGQTFAIPSPLKWGAGRDLSFLPPHQFLTTGVGLYLFLTFDRNWCGGVLFQDIVLVIRASWFHLYPFRTQKLNGIAQTIVVGQPTAKICHRQNNVLKLIKSFSCKAGSGSARKFENPPKGGFFVVELAKL